MTSDIFQSYLMGGFECSTHRNRAGKRVDVIASTEHDRFAYLDYRRLLDLGIRAARDGTRWHLIERTPYRYDWSSVIEQIRAVRETGLQVIWDLFHYGYPDDLDLFGAEFIDRFAGFAGKFVELLVAEGETKPLICLVNEISFFAWAAGEVGKFYPFAKKRGDEMKRQLVKASIAAAVKIKQVAPNAVLIQTDPAIRVLPSKPQNAVDATNFHNAQYHALDMLLGKTESEIGGDSSFVDVIGVNYYSYNQWRHPSGQKILRGQKDYKSFGEILKEFYARYEKPLFIAETGIENEARPDWFKYICDEVRVAVSDGVPVLGICLYPIVNHPGWDNNRHCHNGLWNYANEAGRREIYAPLAAEIRRQMNSIHKAAGI
ncbi:MAG: beta-glucosidase [Pyrinomonadaceae bacterium]